jgi:hypothetical protein
MVAAVDQALKGRLVLSPYRSEGIQANLRYECDDPFAVHLAFPATAALEGEEVEWIFARELLDDGLYEPAGDGDIHLWPCAPGRVMIEFESPHGMALVEFAAADLRDFLHWSYQAVPAGKEGRHVDLDRELTMLLNRSGGS